MHILFPSLPTAPRRPDPDFAIEYDAAQRAGFTCLLYELESLRAGDLGAALATCRSASVQPAPLLYRGWMLRDTHYCQLYDGLVNRGYQPVTHPHQYAQAHYLPNAYPSLTGVTPYTVWIEGADVEQAWSTYQPLADHDVILKDFVKSAKHRWREACFIPAHTARTTFETILHAFLDARGSLFEKGLVFRVYHPLKRLGEDMRGTPTHEEYRVFCWHGRIIAAPDVPGTADVLHEREQWETIAARIDNPFITMDVARQEDDSWIVVEVGDGGVSGLPVSIEPDTFYTALWNAINHTLPPTA